LFFLRLLGAPSLKDRNGVTPPSLGWGKPLALLAFLSVRGETRRDEIVDLLWRDVEEGKARNAFRQALHRLRSALGEDIIPQDREILRLIPGSSLAIDLRDFEAAAASSRVGEAIECYRGEFLAGVVLEEPAFDQWADLERIRLRARFRGVLEHGAFAAQAAGEWAAAIELSRRLVDVAPLDEIAARTAALSLLSAGRRAEARDVIVQFAGRLQAELGLPLPQELRTLLSRLDRLGESAPTSAPPAPATAAQLPFTGREGEMSRLLALWRATSEDAGTLAVVDGEQGIGKSRLVTELAIHAKSLGRATVLVGREHPGTSLLPFASVAEALRPLVRASGVAGASRHLLAEASRLLPELRDTFDLPALPHIEDEASRVRFFEGVAALVDAAAYEQPVMVVLEDLQHASPSTIDLVSYLVGRLAGSAVMFVLTIRAAAASAHVVDRVRGLLAARPGTRALSLSLAPVGTTGAQTSIVPLHASGRAVLQERLRGLSSSQRRTFLVLALLGRRTGVGSLASMAHLTESAARESLHLLEAHALVRRADEMVEADPLAAEVGLETAGEASRAFLAGWIADALAADPRAHPGEIARFFITAGRPRETYTASRRAALAAMRVGAWPEAVHHLHTARSIANEQEIAEVEGLLAGLGAGTPRFARVPVPDATALSDAGAAAPLPPSSDRMASWRERWFPNWRVLFGAALGTLAISAIVMSRTPARVARPGGDTLILAEGDDGRTVRMVTGDLVGGFATSGPVDSRYAPPAWSDSLARRRPDLANARARILGASPDGRWILAAVPRGGDAEPSDADLYAVHLDSDGRVPLDTVAHRSVTEASWSPDGSRIAWVARMGDARQQEVFIAFAGGGGTENVTRHPADDYHIAWSGDGELLGFASMRDGNPELYAFGVQERRLWRLTRDPAQDDWPRFSPSGRFVAFESMRGGEAGVYVMPALGGEAVRVGAGFPLSVREWRGARRYLDRVRIEASSGSSADTVLLRITGYDQRGSTFRVPGAGFRVVDSDVASLASAGDSVSRLLIGRRSGLARVVASVGGWRVDTALVRLGTDAVVLADGSPDARQWRWLGHPPSRATSVGVVLNADGDSENGLLSRDIVPVMPGLELSADFDGLDAVALQRASLSVAVVAPEQAGVLDSLAPQFLRHISASWDGDARRLILAAGREVHAEQTALALDGSVLRFRLRVESDSTVSFHVGGVQRWRSSVKVIDARGVRRAQAWIGGRSTGALRVSAVRVELARVLPETH
jgi:DNA-binding SARP family transcriptional activator/dipeptidyl aminopeptidase/acylaminoacyl peptidase